MSRIGGARGLRTIAAVLAAAIVCAVAASAVPADGDPASDTLLVESAFVPYETPTAAAVADLQKAVAAVYARQERVKVAVIYAQDDLGAIPSLFGQPVQYAHFLGIELGLWYVGPVLVAMPDGLGIYDGGRSTASEQQVLRTVTVGGGTPDDLVRTAAAAVRKMTSAGALRSPDVKAPLVTVYPATATRGKVATLRAALYDDSGRTRAVVRVYENEKLLATLDIASGFDISTRNVAVEWPVPRRLRSRQLRFCVVAVDPSGNRSKPACAIFLRVS